MHTPGAAYRPKHKRDLARQFRKWPTDAERKLWSRLRGKRLGGVKFRRQQPLGAYIADFYCSAAKIIVEIDGAQHGEPARRAHDAARTRFLEDQGYFVLRFTNHEVMRDTDRVLDVIWRMVEIRGRPLPEAQNALRPSPKGRVDWGHRALVPTQEGGLIRASTRTQEEGLSEEVE